HPRQVSKSTEKFPQRFIGSLPPCRSRRAERRLLRRPADRPWRWRFHVERPRQRHCRTFLAVSFTLAFLALMLNTRHDDHNAPADARRAEADEEEKDNSPIMCTPKY